MAHPRIVTRLSEGPIGSPTRVPGDVVSELGREARGGGRGPRTMNLRGVGPSALGACMGAGGYALDVQNNGPDWTIVSQIVVYEQTSAAA
jgi:hypothetical protein